MKRLVALVVLLTLFVAQSQTNIIVIPVGDYTQSPVQTNTQIIVTLLWPNPRTVNNTLIQQTPIPAYTDTNSTAYITNLVWGKYRFDITGPQVTSFVGYVGTNTLGVWQLASLLTNSAALPPNPGTNYYTIAQLNALLYPIQHKPTFDMTGLTFDQN